MKKLVTIGLLLQILGCAQTVWYRPQGKSVTDAYTDKNSCVAESIRVTQSSLGSYFDDCMRSKGYIKK